MLLVLQFLFLASITIVASRIPLQRLDLRASIGAPTITQAVQRTQEENSKPKHNGSQAGLQSGLSVLPTYRVDCFAPRGDTTLTVVNASDCEYIISEMILRLPYPMQEQTFGFNSSADIDLTDRRAWGYGECIITLDSPDHTDQDTFRPVDVGAVAQKILQRCVIGSKTALGGHSDIGSFASEFFVVVGGLEPASQSSTAVVSPNPNLLFPSIIPTDRVTTNDSETSSARSSGNRSDLMDSDSLFSDISCVKPGMPLAAGDINDKDCGTIAKRILQDPKILEPRPFTTEKPGGSQTPYRWNVGNCYIMVNTHTSISTTDSFSLLKVVYYALEVMQKCSLGGVAKIGRTSKFFISVTGVDPAPIQNTLRNILDSTKSGKELSIS